MIIHSFIFFLYFYSNLVEVCSYLVSIGSGEGLALGRQQTTGLILSLCPANERWCYFVTMSLIGWVQA